MDITGISARLERLGNIEGMVIDCSPFDIGRCRTAKIIIPNVNISRNHCQLSYANNTWIVQDLSSSGTYLNEELIGKGNCAILKNNDIITLGPKECGFTWQFKTILEKDTSRILCDDIGTQSQNIMDICNQKQSLQKRIILNRESYKKMRMEEEKLHEQCFSQVKELEEKISSVKSKAENQSEEIQSIILKEVEEEKKRIHNEMKNKLLQLQEKITDNERMEEILKLEIQNLQDKLITEQLQWENRFLDEKKKLEEKIIEQNEKLNVEKRKAEEISLKHGQELEVKLKKEEEEKKALLEKLHEMEEAKDMLSLKLKESYEIHLMEKARLEEEMKKELMKKEENIKAVFQEKIDFLQKNQSNSQITLKAEAEEEEKRNGREHLQMELDGVKTTLVQTESRQKLLEKELAKAESLKDEASKLKSTVLESIADLMETELQCSVCSELFVTAITLNCTHTFCKFCIDTWKKKKKNCPICRKKITSENRSIVMDNYIDKMVENLSDEFKTRRKEVIAARNADVPGKKAKVTAALSRGPQQTFSAPLQSRGSAINVGRSGRQVSRVSSGTR